MDEQKQQAREALIRALRGAESALREALAVLLSRDVDSTSCPVPTECTPGAGSSASQTPEDRIKRVRGTRARPPSPWEQAFEGLWLSHPKNESTGSRGDKQRARKEWRLLEPRTADEAPKRALFELIVAAHDRARESEAWKKGMVQHFERWLRGRSWEG